MCVCRVFSAMSDCLATNCSPLGFSVHRILQARILECVALPSSRVSSWPRGQTCVSYVSLHWQADSLPLAPPGKPRSQLPAPKSLLPLAWCCRDFPGVACPSDIRGVVNTWCLLGRAPTAPVLAWKSEARPWHPPPVPCVLTAPVTLAWFLTLTCARLQPATEPLDMVSVLQTKELSLLLLLPLTPTSPFYFRSWATWPGKPYLEYYPAIKRNKIGSFVVTCMNLESVIQTEVSQKEKNEYPILMHTYRV